MVTYIEEHRKEFGVEPICRVLQVASSTYYAARSRLSSARQLRDAVLMPILAGDLDCQLRGVWGPQNVEGDGPGWS